MVVAGWCVCFLFCRSAGASPYGIPMAPNIKITTAVIENVATEVAPFVGGEELRKRVLKLPLVLLFERKDLRATSESDSEDILKELLEAGFKKKI